MNEINSLKKSLNDKYVPRIKSLQYTKPDIARSLNIANSSFRIVRKIHGCVGCSTIININCIGFTDNSSVGSGVYRKFLCRYCAIAKLNRIFDMI